MPKCNVCGLEHVEFRHDARQYLCRECYQDTPGKVSKEEFDRAYWENPEEIPARTKREFYEDYLASMCNLEQYIKTTTSA